MAFDPSKIKKRKLTPENLPDGASREDKVLALANVLHERGLTSSIGDAKRLAEGMVETERKVIGDTSTDTGHDELRSSFQRVDSPLFQAVGGKSRLNISAELRAFVQQAAPLQSSRKEMEAVPSAPRPPELKEAPAPEQVFYDEAPQESTRDPEWKMPEKASDPGYSKTLVETSDEGVVVRHVEATATTDSVEERGVILEDETLEEEAEEKSPEAGVDLFDVFNANKE